MACEFWMEPRHFWAALIYLVAGEHQQGCMLNRSCFPCSTGLSCTWTHSSAAGVAGCSRGSSVALWDLSSSSCSARGLAHRSQQRRGEAPGAVDTHSLLHRKQVVIKSQIFPAHSSQGAKPTWEAGPQKPERQQTETGLPSPNPLPDPQAGARCLPSGAQALSHPTPSFISVVPGPPELTKTTHP